jgi:hypothetical protein
MPSLRTFFLASLACAGLVNANTCKQDYSINSDGDVSQLSGCDTVKGTITVGSGVVNFSMSDVQNIQGDLNIKGASGLTLISCPQLQSISGGFNLQELTILQTLSCPSLTQVGTINWVTLPAWNALEFTAEVTQCTEVLITDTILTSLDGINLVTADMFNINNNKYLKTVNVALNNVTGALSIEFNSKDVDVSFPDLAWAMNITVRDAGSVSFPKLQGVNSTIAFINNTFTDCQFPALTQVGQSFAFNSNSQLTNITASKLETIGGTFQIANNTKLLRIDSFQDLTSVDGSVDFSGAFTYATLPSLDDVRGGFNVQTTANFSCTEFDNYHSSGVIKGDGYTCAGKLDEAKSSTGGASTGSGGSSDNANKTGSATRAGVNALVLLAAGAVVLVL